MSTDRPDFPSGYRIIDPHDPFETGTGPFYAPKEGGDFHLLLQVGPPHCNRSGVVHGGLLMTMADVTVCAAAVIDAPHDERAITVSLNADFVAAAVEGDMLEARAEIIRRTGSLVFARGEIRVGPDIVMTASAVIKRMRRG